MKTIINLELSKKLAPYLEGIDTEYVLSIYNELYKSNLSFKIEDWYIKTLTLEEAIEFLQKKEIRFTIEFGGEWYFLIELFGTKFHYNSYTQWQISLLEAIEKMLEYLLVNDLLTYENN